MLTFFFLEIKNEILEDNYEGILGRDFEGTPVQISEEFLEYCSEGISSNSFSEDISRDFLKID